MESFLKRKATQDNGGNAKHLKRENCPHAERCYRRNPHHFKEYEHPHLLKLIENDSEIPTNFPQDKQIYLEQIAILKPLILSDNKQELLNNQPSTSNSTNNNNLENKQRINGTMLERLQQNQPYSIFFTTIPKSPQTLKHYNSITFTDLLCPSLGDLKCSLQINFMIDIAWLMQQYKIRNLHTKPLTILYGDDWPDMKEYIQRFLPNVTEHFVKMKDPFGTHHSKIGIYVYSDESIRVVVSTANLYYEDWNHYNQGLWISPLCKKLSDSCKETDGESPTGFKISLINYLKHYNLDCLKQWIDYVTHADFSEIKVFLITSVPGRHFPKDPGSHLTRINDLLLRHCELPTVDNIKKESPTSSSSSSSWPILIQSSSIGSLGKQPDDWLKRSLLHCLSGNKTKKFQLNSNTIMKIIFPTVQNVLNGYFGPDSGGCLPYSKQTNEKQRWLQNYLHQWKADRLERTRAMPHIKTYCRISPDFKHLAWFLLTSANLSKSAWGSGLQQQKNNSTYVRSYEVGVLFLPKFFNVNYFEIERNNCDNQQLFPFIYDLPLTPYSSDDYPWCN